MTPADQEFYAGQVRLAIMKLNHHYGSACPMPQVQWTLRGKTKLGVAQGFQLIKLNAAYASAMGRDEYLQTVLHEACHIITTWRRHVTFKLAHQSTGPWAPHGPEWRKAMRLLGLSPDRTACISPEVNALVKPARVTNKVPIYCSCTTHWVTVARAKRVIETGAVLRCRVCKTVCRVPGARKEID